MIALPRISRSGPFVVVSLFALLTLSSLVISCAKQEAKPTPTPSTTATSCPAVASIVIAPSTGTANVFLPDPIIASGDAALSPTSKKLDNYLSKVELKNLDGRGILSGKYVSIRSGLACGAGYGAYEPGNSFLYSHSNAYFQEAMSYYFGDQYREFLDSTGSLQPANAVKIIAHCMNEDNAYFVRSKDDAGVTIDEKVCLGDSTDTHGASYSDDGTVTIHELQHATTVDTYSVEESLSGFFYDEAGAINEAVSDFMALLYTSPWVSAASLDPRLFSRWALGSFQPGLSGVRGAHRCPVYDSDYPNCGGFPGFSADKNTISYIYPDGLGWPYANNFEAPGYAASAFVDYRAQDEIHNAGTLFLGALWDAFDLVSKNYPDVTIPQVLMTKLVMESLKHLPHRTLTDPSPVTMRAFASTMIEWASAVGFSADDTAALTKALKERGLYEGTLLPSTWATVGPGWTNTPGVYIKDNPIELKAWLEKIGGDSTLISQTISTGLNAKLDPGEVAAIWFDIQNTSNITAGGILLTITSLDPEVTLLNGREANIASISSTQAQVLYHKINGTAVVAALTSAKSTYDVPTGNSYFQTNPYYHRAYTSTLWVRVDKGATHGKKVRFKVEAKPSNGETSIATFETVIN
ncbi:hypothetical protein WDW86_01270 [Bdellovibrionota bacterium FG-2]